MIDEEIYAEIQSNINSDGLWNVGVSIFFSGCDKPIKCKGCHNYEIQKQKVGFKTTTSNLLKDVDCIVKDWFDIYDEISICYLGGEPTASWNRNSVLEISKFFKNKYGSDICNILYSWRYKEDIESKYIKYMDFGVLGEFQEDNLAINEIPASKNQYIYDFKNNKKINPIKRGNKI